jgi:hypothetical protein
MSMIGEMATLVSRTVLTTVEGTHGHGQWAELESLSGVRSRC